MRRQQARPPRVIGPLGSAFRRVMHAGCRSREAALFSGFVATRMPPPSSVAGTQKRAFDDVGERSTDRGTGPQDKAPESARRYAPVGARKGVEDGGGRRRRRPAKTSGRLNAVPLNSRRSADFAPRAYRCRGSGTTLFPLLAPSYPGRVPVPLSCPRDRGFSVSPWSTIQPFVPVAPTSDTDA
jgi:hypothetical protein